MKVQENIEKFLFASMCWVVIYEQNSLDLRELIGETNFEVKFCREQGLL